MSWSFRRSLVVLLVLLVAVCAFWLEDGRAQVAKTIAVPIQAAPPAANDPQAGLNPDGFLNSGISLPKDEKNRRKAIEAADDYIREQKWAIAIPHLQKLVEIDEDVFVHLKRQSAEGKEVLTWVSVKQEANRLLSSLPSAGLDFYKLTYGAKAADMLKKAKQNGDPALLAEIMKKYAHTDAGGEATKLLADYHLDRGNYMPALLCYSKLFNRQGADKLPIEVVQKAYIAARKSPIAAAAAHPALAGNTVSVAELLKRLREHGRELRFGDQTLTLEDLDGYIAKLDRPNFSQDATDAIVFRATPSRNNQLVGGPAFMVANWRKSMLKFDSEKDSSVTYKRIKEATRYWEEGRKQPIIPAFAPITVTVTRGEQKMPLLIYRNYWGIIARNLKKVRQGNTVYQEGDIAWESPSTLSLEHIYQNRGDARKQQAMTDWLNFYVGQNGNQAGQQPQILFENSTVGTLSTDGQYVYAVEDLAVPPPPQMMNMMNMGVPNGGMNAMSNYGSDIQDAVSHNRLLAYSLATNGKLTWELGDTTEKGPLSDCYFLGPPLPLGGKLYVLIEKQQELRLVCLDPEKKGAIVTAQTLGTTQEKMQNDVLRRTNAAQLSYGEGILVCPTNAGAVFGINLLENSLVWAYPYREKSDNKPRQDMNGQAMMMRGMGRRVIIGPNGQPIQPPAPQHNHWKASAPVIADGKVVFTAPDARSIHCINLRDGSPVWHKPKQEEDLYLGNVYNGKVLIVGKTNVRALSLSSGEILWTLPTGLPSGQGIGSDNVYYLPLKEAGKDKEPQICAIDMERGKIIGATPSRPKSTDKNDYDVPGNLLFYEGDVVSLTPTEVVVYPQLKVKLAQMDELISKNPNDPVALTERGDLRRVRGDLAGAIDDLSTALKNNPDKDTRGRARAKLYDTLTAYITDHFNDAEKYLKDYEELCNVEMDGATGEELKKLQAEQRRRRATFLWLVGKGREDQGRLVEAFEKYQEFGAVAGKNQELVPAVDERQVKAAPDVWSRGRIIAMMANAKPEHRQPLEKLIAAKWENLRQSNDLDELRRFVRIFGSVSAAGQEARLQLVDRLMEQKEGPDEHPLLEAELELNQFRTGEHSPELAARATEALARLYTRKGLLEDAAYCYRRLGTDYADVIIQDGKTGRDFYNDTATDKRLLPYLDEPDPLGSTKLKAKKENEAARPPDNGQLFQFEHSGEALPFFRRHIVGLSLNTHQFKLLDRTAGERSQPFKEVWSQPLARTMFQVLSNQVLGQHQMNQFNRFNRFGGVINVNNNDPLGRDARFPYRTLGHLVVLPVCDMVFGIDPVNRRVLWQQNLAPISGPISANGGHPNGLDPLHPPAVDPRDGSVVVTYNDGWTQRLGQTGPLQGQALCLQVHNTLTALDPLTGRTLWSRMDVDRRNYLFADENHVFVIELDSDNAPSATRVFRAADGITVKVPDFTAVFKKRQQIFGRLILASESSPTGGIQLRLYDPLTARDVWQHNYPARSLLARSEDESLAGVVEPNGKVHVIDLAARKEVMAGQLANPAHDLQNVQVVHLLADRTNFYFAFQAPMQANNANPGMGVVSGMQSNVMTQLGMRTVPVNGALYSFKRDTGEYAWFEKGAKNQMLVLDQFGELPVVLLTARKQEFQQFNGRMQSQASVMSIEKRSGKVLFSDDDMNITNFWGVRVDNRSGTIDFLSMNARIRHEPKADDEDKTTSADVSARQGAQASPEAVDVPRRERLRREEIERARIREIVTPPSR